MSLLFLAPNVVILNRAPMQKYTIYTINKLNLTVLGNSLHSDPVRPSGQSHEKSSPWSLHR